MKKFMKALALALALCMVLSVSAFAEVGKTDDGTPADTTARTIEFTVTGLKANEQVALLVLKDGVTGGVSAASEENILYIDQKAVAADATSVAFTATIAAGEGNDVVDVYVGSQTINSEKSAAWLVYEDVAVANTSSITIAGDAKFVNVNQVVNGETITRPGAAVGITINNLTPARMVWALKGTDGTYKYSKAIDVDLAGVETSAPIWFTGIFSSTKLDGFTIDKVAAIFKATDASEHFIGDSAEKDTVMNHKKNN